jgi:hypothetical protein
VQRMTVSFVGVDVRQNVDLKLDALPHMNPTSYRDTQSDCLSPYKVVFICGHSAIETTRPLL